MKQIDNTNTNNDHYHNEKHPVTNQITLEKNLSFNFNFFGKQMKGFSEKYFLLERLPVMSGSLTGV